ncbi:MAG: hypothetical protein NTW96_17695 [Planctomycetia bacterium]|nr:hypothetical protein [Planctomycetia bacterium]
MVAMPRGGGASRGGPNPGGSHGLAADRQGPANIQSPTSANRSGDSAHRGESSFRVDNEQVLGRDRGESSTGQPSLSDIRKRIPGSSQGPTERSKSSEDRSPLRDPRGSGDRQPLSATHDGASRGDAHGPRGDIQGPKGDVRGPKGDGRGPDHGRQSFQDHYKADQFRDVTRGSVAKGLRLDDQYRMHDKGDVARRLDLDRHRPGGVSVYRGPHGDPRHMNYYRGWVSPYYAHSGFQFYYHGPGYYASLYSYGSPYYWYPRWTPWVTWSWGYDCDPYWDPRPIYCRPIVYVAARPWVWWECPVWTPLPVVACGTWVDVEPILVAPARLDLQLLAVRFVDPGHPDEKLGPRYRVWFRNNSTVAINQPFDVVLLAGNDDKAAAGLPQAGVRVASIKAGEVQSVDIRLPFEVQQMGRDANGQPIPFKSLHVLVDANQEIAETTKINNGAQLAAEVVLPVDPAAFETEPKDQVPGGGEIIVAGEGFGPEPGRVLVQLGGLELEAEILGWYDLGVRLKAPNLPLAGPAESQLIVVRADGAATNPLSITVMPAALAQPPAPAVPPPPAAMPPAPAAAPAEEVLLPPALPQPQP